MVDQVVQLLTSGSPMVAFAIYLIWSNSRSEKRLDEVNSQFMDRVDKMVGENKIEIEKLRDRHEQREDELRERWQGVVSQLQNDREIMERDLLRTAQTTHEAVNKLSQAIEGFSAQVLSISQTMDRISERLQQVDTKADRIIDRGS